jgi:hypothetical protein
LGARFTGSNPAEGDGVLRAIKIRSTPSFEGEVILYGLLKIPSKYEQRDFVQPNS